MYRVFIKYYFKESELVLKIARLSRFSMLLSCSSLRVPIKYEKVKEILPCLHRSEFTDDKNISNRKTLAPVRLYEKLSLSDEVKSKILSVTVN